MNPSTLKNYRRNQRRQRKVDDRNQATREIKGALDARAVDFAEDARKINELYERFAAESDANGFAEAVINYAGRSQTLVNHIAEFRAIVNGHLYHAVSEDTVSPQEAESLTPTEVAHTSYDREQKLLGAMNDAFQKLLRKII